MPTLLSNPTRGARSTILWQSAAQQHRHPASRSVTWAQGRSQLDTWAGPAPKRPAQRNSAVGPPAAQHGWLTASQPVRALKRPWMQPELWRALKRRLLSLGGDANSVAQALVQANFWHPYAAWATGGTYWLSLWGQMAASIHEMALLAPDDRRWAGRILAPIGPLLGVEAGELALQRVALALQRGTPPEVLLGRARQVAECVPLAAMGFPDDKAAFEDVHVSRTHLVRDVFAALVEADGAQDAAAAYLLQVIGRTFVAIVAQMHAPLPLLAEDPADAPQRRLVDVILDAGADGGRVRPGDLADLIVSQAGASIEDTAEYLARWLPRSCS